MAVFASIPGATVIVKRMGVYRQAEVFKYDNRLFAKIGGGFVALHRDGDTSVTRTHWEALEGVVFTIKTGKSTLYWKRVGREPCEILKKVM